MQVMPKTDYRRKRETFFDQLAVQESPFERVRYSCLVYLQGGQIDVGTFIHTLAALFSNGEGLQWMQREFDLKKFAELVCQRDRARLAKNGLNGLTEIHPDDLIDG